MQPSPDYPTITDDLRRAYDAKAGERDAHGTTDWKVAERARFLGLLQAEGKTTLLEIGAGPGRDSLFFQEQGFQVTATDLSPENVARCRAKGLTAYEMDFSHLDFPDASFDAVYALNCLLHVPKVNLPDVLQEVQRVLKSNGLFFLGLYGGPNSEGPLPEDRYEPKRFFSFHTDEAMQAAVRPFFKLVQFKAIPLDDDPLHFQSFILRKE